MSIINSIIPVSIALHELMLTPSSYNLELDASFQRKITALHNAQKGAQSAL